jgi:catecholate siderophore receptor
MMTLFSILYGQNAQLSLHGRILDPAGLTVSGAQVTATSDRYRSEVATFSDANGDFSLTLPPGTYVVKITAPGFAPFSQVVELSVPDGEPRALEFKLQVAGIVDTVTVTESGEYQVSSTRTATKTLTPLRDIPQSISIVTKQQVRDQLMLNVGDVVRYIPGVAAHQGENNRDQIIMRGNSSSADFFVNGVRDDVQYYRDLYNAERIEALKGPNAMIFGRGGGGGVINRVTKEAGFTPLREFTLLGGSHANRRFTTDFGQPITDRVAVRINGVYENSDSFRKFVNLERYGINPTVSVAATADTMINVGFEHFHDGRVADRGIPSFDGRPADLDTATYIGNPNDSWVRARVNLAYASLERQAGRLNVQNRVSFGDYDRGYQNYVPGAVDPTKTQIAVSAYNNATQRKNLFNQTNLTYSATVGGVRNTVLGGMEIGRQQTDNLRNTGYFNNTATTSFVPYTDTIVRMPVTFRQSATDANNHVQTNLAALYAQDQVSLSKYVEVIGGVRFDYFDLKFHNNRTKEDLRRIDNLISPRAGLVLKPIARLTAYGSYSVSYLPSSGDQFSSLTTVTQQVKPEKFNNVEVGIKWDVRPDLSLTSAVYRLDRTNTRSTDPNDPTRIIQTGRTRSDGYELGVNGKLTRRWIIAGGYAYQNAFISSATSAAPAGAQIAQVPHHTFSVWNKYQITPRIGAGLGLLNRSEMFAAIDNKVTLPGYTRADVAVYVPLNEKMRLQANVENLFNRKYYINADSNTNISPGSSRALRVALTTSF